MPTKYFFIDAACLDNRVQQIANLFCDGDDLEINWPALAGSYRKVFFYDALPGQKRGEDESDFSKRYSQAERRHEYLQTLDRYRVYQGDARWRKGRGHEQKKVDVMITVDMLKHTIRGNMDEATLVASDVDFRPLLDALSDEGMFTRLIYNPKNTSTELLGSADSRTALTASYINGWFTPESQEKTGIIGSRSRGVLPIGELVREPKNPKFGKMKMVTGVHPDGRSRYFLSWKEPNIGNDWISISAWTTKALVALAKEDYDIEITS